MPVPPSPALPARDCWYLTGPTAAGKTQVGLELAERLNAEIISLDSMAVYQGMDIGTAKPTPADRARVVHHLIDVVPPTEDFSLSEYIDAAHAAIREIRGRGRQVLFVGGTPLYLKALLRGVYRGPPPDWAFRMQIEEELRHVPITALHERLQIVDPLLAARLHPHDKRRIIRGLEVFKLTGQRLSHWQTQFDEGRPAHEVKVFVLDWPREKLHRRIEARVRQMFAAGLVEEVRGLVARYGQLSRTAMQAVGYREVLRYLGLDAAGTAGGLPAGGAARRWPSVSESPPEEASMAWQERTEPGEAGGLCVEEQTPRTAAGRSAARPAGARTAEEHEDAMPRAGFASSDRFPAAEAWSMCEEKQPAVAAAKTLEACMQQVIVRTRRFARRQETWFRALSECTRVPWQKGMTARAMAETILELAHARDAGSIEQPADTTPLA